MTTYGFRSALGAIFAVDEGAAAARLPRGLHPFALRPGAALLALTAFDFDESEVGPYRELVLSILVPPHAPRGEPLPDLAIFPFALATTSEASRRHAAERWRLPELDRCLDIALEHQGPQRRLQVGDAGRELLSLALEVEPRESDHTATYQCFSGDAEGLWRVGIRIVGCYGEHEDERGRLRLGDHPLAHELEAMLLDELPLREHAMDRGRQFFGRLEQHALLRRPA